MECNAMKTKDVGIRSHQNAGKFLPLYTHDACDVTQCSLLSRSVTAGTQVRSLVFVEFVVVKMAF